MPNSASEKQFENWSIFDEENAYKNCVFWDTL